MGMAVLTGNHDLVIQALEVITSFDKACEDAAYTKRVFDLCSGELKHYLQHIKQAFESDTDKAKFHYLSQQNLMGVFGIAHADAASVLAGSQEKYPPQLTSDGNGYLYIAFR